MKDSDILQHPAIQRFVSLPKQALLSDPENGVHGDCWRCCVAAILSLPPTKVPHFMELSLASDAPSMHTLTQRWLYERGYWLVQTKSKPYAIQSWGDNILTPPVMVSGPTVRSTRPEQQHVVVMVGGALVYDPHPSNAGLLAETDYALIVPHYPGIYPNLQL